MPRALPTPFLDSFITGAETGFNGTVTGTIKVQLYDIDSDGEYVYKDWSVWDGNFPFGSIWVYAFNVDQSTGDETYYANQSILTPSVDGDTYSLTFNAATASVRVGAQLDFYADGVLENGPADLTGLAGLAHWWRCGNGPGDGPGIIKDQVGSANLLPSNGSPLIVEVAPYA